MTAARIPREHFAKGLRYSIYSVFALLCLVFSFSVGESQANAANTIVIDLTFTTTGAGQTIVLPISSGTGNTYAAGVSVNWDVGVSNYTTTLTSATDVTDATFTPSLVGGSTPAFGTYHVQVSASSAALPLFTHFGYTHTVTGVGKPWGSGASYLMAVNSWTNFTNLEGAFVGATNLFNVIPAALPGTVTNLSYAFFGDTSINTSNISSWDTSSVTDMSFMFTNATSFDQALNYGATPTTHWDTTNVLSMAGMFSGSIKFNNGSVASNWGTKTAKVTDMSYMFMGATSFNQNISGWSTAAVTTMAYMFFGGTSGATVPIFGTPTIFNDNGVSLNTVGAAWNVSAVRDFSYMFGNDSFINSALANSNWSIDTAQSVLMKGMFEMASIFNQNISGWNTSRVTDMSFMFFGGTQSTAAPTTVMSTPTVFNDNGTKLAWNVNSVTTFNYMFANNSAISSALNATTWAPGGSSTMQGMFELATSFNANISGWTTSAVTDMSFMFFGGTQNAGLPPTLTTAMAFNDGATSLSTWVVTTVTNFNYMFANDTSLNVAMTSWAPNNGAAVTMQGMFDNATTFNQSISGWNVSRVTDMSYMFTGASAFNKDLSTWGANTFRVTTMQSIFQNSGETFGIGAWSIVGITGAGLTNWAAPATVLSIANFSHTFYQWSQEAIVNTGVTATAPGLYYNEEGRQAYVSLTGAGRLWTLSTYQFYAITATVGSDGTNGLGLTIRFTATVTGNATLNAITPVVNPANVMVPNTASLWTITAPAGANTTCVTNTITPAMTVTYTCDIVESVAGTYSAAFKTSNFPTNS
ncbi:MAG: BspA family leucine-rich repeat surface protein, partial [Mariniphaga sp.]